MAGLVELMRVHDLASASILQGRLASEGIAALLFDTGMSGLYGGAFPAIRLMVAETDLALAMELLELPENEADDQG